MNFECESCSATFYSQYVCEGHMDEYDHWPNCESCSRTFHSWNSCHQHMNAVKHWAPEYECETCDRTFGSQHAADQHMDALDHWDPEYECETCGKTFRSQKSADQHMDALGHWAPEISCGSVTMFQQYKNYCPDCDRWFENKNNLRMHFNSKIHRGSGISCPYCRAGYTTSSGLTHHLEMGSCPSAPGMDREAIFRMVSRIDPYGLVTNKENQWRDGANAHYSATDQAWNGCRWECYLCHKVFKTINALNSHLNSPVHKQQVYHCPNNQCSKHFATLAGFFNHLESESCSFVRFERVQNRVGDILRGRGMISF